MTPMKCAYHAGCKAPVVYRVTEHDDNGARHDRLRYACAVHYPGSAKIPPPAEPVTLTWAIFGCTGSYRIVPLEA